MFGRSLRLIPTLANDDAHDAIKVEDLATYTKTKQFAYSINFIMVSACYGHYPISVAGQMVEIHLYMHALLQMLLSAVYVKLLIYNL